MQGTQTESWRDPVTWARVGLVAAAYYVLAQIGLQFALSEKVASPIWPPAGLAVAAAVLGGRRLLPGVFLGVLATELLAGISPQGATLMAMGTAAEAGIAAWLIHRGGGRAAPLRLPGVGWLAVAALSGPAVAAATGTGALLWDAIIPAQAAPQVYLTWYLGDVAGILLVAPVLLLLPGTRLPRPTPSRLTEATAVLMLLASAVTVVFGIVELPLAFLTLPPLVWIALRFGPRPTAWAVLGLDGFAVLMTAQGRGPFVQPSANTSFLLLQAFALAAALLAACVAAIALDRKQWAGQLEQRVTERTTSLAELNSRLEAEVAERRAAEAAMAEAQRAAQMGTWTWDLRKPHAEWSEELYRIYGLPTSHVPSYEDYLARIHPDDVERVKAATEQVLQEGKPYSHDERIRRADGQWRHLHTWAHAVRDATGKVVELRGACQDVTERVGQETMFRSLLESAPDAMVIADDRGRIVLVNGQAEKLFGHRREEMVGQPVEMLVPAGAQGRHAHHRASYAHHPSSRPMGAGLDLKARRRDGTEFPVEVSLSPIETPTGRLVASAIRDVTARRKADQDLAESLERFRALADASPIGIVHTTPQGSVDYANKTWSRITGVADFRDDDAVRHAIHPEDQPRSWRLWGEALSNGMPFEDEMRWVHPDGTIRTTSCRAVPVRAADGRINGFVSTVEDITDRRAAEEARLKDQAEHLEVRRLREQAEFKTNFLRTAAHELGTPLTPLKIQVRVLHRLLAASGPPDAVRSVDILDRNLVRLEMLVRDLLESARLQSGRLRLKVRPMDLAHSVHDAVESFQESAMQAGVTLDAKVPQQLPLLADPDRVAQVLYNLLSNATKFTPQGGRVHVEAAVEGEVAVVRVRDTGNGFDPGHADRLFQAFSQLTDSFQTKAGSGLGLYISRGIVEQHGGRIKAESSGPGRGATFEFTLPLVAKDADAPVPSAPPPVPGAFAPPRGAGVAPKLPK